MPTISQTLKGLAFRSGLQLAGWLFVALGSLLRARQYLENLSISGDEASLALNIVDRTFRGLVHPLDYEQGAPIVFLFAEKLAVTLLGNRDLVLRIVPLLSALVAMYLMYRFASGYFGVAGLFAVFAFAISLPSIRYSAYVKQYSSDAMIALLLTCLVGPCLSQQARARDFLVLGIAGTFAIWISHPSILVLAGIGLVLLLESWSRKDPRARLRALILGGVWIFSFGVSYLVFLRHLASDVYLQNYWRHGYAPIPPWAEPGWFVQAYLSLLSVSFDRTEHVFAFACLFLILLGAASLLVRSRRLAILTISPLAMAGLASLLQKYPLDGRFMLFMVPFVLLLMAEGVGRAYSLLGKWSRSAAVLASVAICCAVLWYPALATYRNFRSTIRPWDIRPIMQHIAEHASMDQTIYISGGGQAPAYYAAVYGLNSDQLMLKNAHRIVGWWHFKKDLAALVAGDRAWVVFAHLEYPKDDRYVKRIYHTGVVQEDIQSSDARAFLLGASP